MRESSDTSRSAAPASKLPPVHFVVQTVEPEILALEAAGPLSAEAIDRTVAGMLQGGRANGETAWIVQTYLRLKQRGYDVHLVNAPVRGGMCVAHFDLVRSWMWGRDAFVIGVRADRSPLVTRELEIVQSPANLGRARDRVLITHWPQPLLTPREEGRGGRVERMCFFGRRANLEEGFLTEAFRADLQRLGVTFDIRFDPADWADYREADLVLAVRNLHPVWLNTKPATKLVNAWLAGSVAILGPEPAYRHIGEPGSDFLEATTPEEVLRLVAELKAQPERFDAIRKRSVERGQDYTAEHVTDEWVRMLEGPAHDQYVKWQALNAVRRFRRRLRQSVLQRAAHRVFWTRVHLSDRLVGRGSSA